MILARCCAAIEVSSAFITGQLFHEVLHPL
jgi:hypothetical protein